MTFANALYHFVFKRQDAPWEVVDSKAVEPVTLWDDDDGMSLHFVSLACRVLIMSIDLDIIYIHETEIIRQYVFDVHAQSDLRRAVVFAQKQMLYEINSKGYNALWCEGYACLLSS